LREHETPRHDGSIANPAGVSAAVRPVVQHATLPFYWGTYEPTPGQRNDGKLRMMAAAAVVVQMTK
jgi:hypothetical protein